jgi:hypothetical protein
MKGDKLKIEDINTGAKLPISPADGLYKSLVQAKYRGDTPASMSVELSRAETETAGLNEEQAAYKSQKR